MTCFADRTVVLWFTAGLLLVSAGAVCCASAQQPGAAGPRSVILLDPAHGGPDPGAHLANGAVEKDVTFALAAKIRATLGAAGFTVVSTRDGDPSTVLTADQRAELANRTRALACLVIHATSTGSGAHLYISSLQSSAAPSAAGERQPFAPVRWDRAQAGFVGQSAGLRKDLAAALGSVQVPALSGVASVRPLDNLLCPAVAIELAPLADPASDRTPVTDGGYQQRVADAVTTALKAWHAEAQPTDAAQPSPAGDGP